MTFSFSSPTSFSYTSSLFLFSFFNILSHGFMHNRCFKRILRLASEELFINTMLYNINSETIINTSRIFNSSKNIKGYLLVMYSLVKSPFATSIGVRPVAKKGLPRNDRILFILLNVKNNEIYH